MFAASTYEEIEKIERQVENHEIVVFLFVKSSETEIIKEFEYIHYNSDGYCSIYAIGYTDDFDKSQDPTYHRVNALFENEWYYSVKAFVDFKNMLEKRIKWRYSGETDLLILQNNPGKRNSLNFRNYVAIDIKKGIREGYIDSFQCFMESLVRSAKHREIATDVIRDVSNDRVSLKDILSYAIEDCKRIPKPAKEIIKDRLFYRSANNFS